MIPILAGLITVFLIASTIFLLETPKSVPGVEFVAVGMYVIVAGIIMVISL